MKPIQSRVFQSGEETGRDSKIRGAAPGRFKVRCPGSGGLAQGSGDFDRDPCVGGDFHQFAVSGAQFAAFEP